MFRFVVFFAVVACAVAKPGLLGGAPTAYTTTEIKPRVEIEHVPIVEKALYTRPTTFEVHEPYEKEVGKIVKSYPSAKSYQHVSIEHGETKTFTPVLKKDIKSYTVPEFRTVEKAVVRNVQRPIIKTIEPIHHHEYIPQVKTITKSFVAPTLVKEAVLPAPIFKEAVHHAPIFNEAILPAEGQFLGGAEFSGHLLKGSLSGHLLKEAHLGGAYEPHFESLDGGYYHDKGYDYGYPLAF